MGTLYRKDLDKYKNYFDESAKLLGVSVKYYYIIKRNTENTSGESIYSELSKPINQNVIIESGLPMVNSLKQLGWFVDTEKEELLVDFSYNTPNLQEGCQFSLVSNENKQQNKRYIITKLSNEQLYPTCIKCLCVPVLKNESNVDKYNQNIQYGQQNLLADDENYTFINEEPEITIF